MHKGGSGCVPRPKTHVDMMVIDLEHRAYCSRSANAVHYTYPFRLAGLPWLLHTDNGSVVR